LGGLGNHRYQIVFSGDTVSAWPSLAFQPYFTATAANVGYAYWSHDIGGHMPGPVGPELYTRWIQFGIFSPILRTHTTKNPDAERRIWAYPEPYADIMRRAFVLRNALIPYIYTEARRTYDTGVAFLRPLYYDSPEAVEAYRFPHEYNFGDSLIAAPITQAVAAKTGWAETTVWLPPGEWIEWPTATHLTGPGTFTRKFSLSQIPLYVKAGAILPMQPEMSFSNEKPLDPLILNVFPLAEGESSAYRLYEDAGDNALGYKQGQCRWTDLQARQAANSLVVEIAPVQGAYPGSLAARGYELRLPGDWPPQSVTVDGQPLGRAESPGQTGWSYDGPELATVIRLPASSVLQPRRIEVRTPADLHAQRRELDGVPGALARLREAYDTLNQWGGSGWFADPLIVAMQTGDRLTYHPEHAEQEVRQLRQALPGLIGLVDQLRPKAVGRETAHPWEKAITPEQLAARAQAEFRRRNQLVDRAVGEVTEAVVAANPPLPATP
jgi:hypothetical protein